MAHLRRIRRMVTTMPAKPPWPQDAGTYNITFTLPGPAIMVHKHISFEVAFWGHVVHRCFNSIVASSDKSCSIYFTAPSDNGILLGFRAMQLVACITYLACFIVIVSTYVLRYIFGSKATRLKLQPPLSSITTANPNIL